MVKVFSNVLDDFGVQDVFVWRDEVKALMGDLIMNQKFLVARSRSLLKF